MLVARARVTSTFMTKVLLPLVLLAALLGGAALVHPTSTSDSNGSSQVAPGSSDMVLAAESDPTEPTEPVPNEPTLPTLPNEPPGGEG